MADNNANNQPTAPAKTAMSNRRAAVLVGIALVGIVLILALMIAGDSYAADHPGGAVDRFLEFLYSE